MQRYLCRLFVAMVLLTGFSASVWAQQPADRNLQSFLLAVKASDFSFISRMEKLGLGPQTKDALGNNLLMLAIREAGPRMALLMLEDPKWQATEVLDYENQIGENALMLAALAGENQVIRRLIALGAQVSRWGWSPLHYAATSGHVETIELLLEHHAYVDTESPNKTTPLMMAARFNHINAAKTLLAAGADPTLVNEAGMRAKTYASEANNRDLEFFLELEEISFESRRRHAPVSDKAGLSLEEIVIEAGGSVVVEPDAQSSAKPAPAGEGVELFQGIR